MSARDIEGHTPGPWFANLHHEKRDGGRFHAFVTAGGLVPVACVPTGGEGFGREEGRANAALVAIAPTLFAEIAALKAENDELRTGLQSVAGNMLNIQIGLDTGDTKAVAAQRLCETVNIARAILRGSGESG